MMKSIVVSLILFLLLMHHYTSALELDNDSVYVMTDENGMIGSEDFDFKVLDSSSQAKIDFPLCSDNPPDLDECSNYVCKVKTPFGEIFAKVKGMQDDQCQYIERTFGLNGINCQFKRSDLKAFNKLFARRFKKLSGNKILLTSLEYKSLEDIFRRECSIVPDYNSSKLIPIHKINSNELDPEFKIEDLSKYLRLPTPKIIELDNTESESQGYKVDLDNYKSIMLRK